MGNVTALIHTLLKPTHARQLVTPILSPIRYYIQYMADIYDYTEFKLHQLMESAAETEHYDTADDLRLVLDGYLLGELSIEWVNGWPMPSYVERIDVEG